MNYDSYKGRGKDKISGAERPITYLPDAVEWVNKIYCFEDETDQYTADEVLGGTFGVDNAQAQALSNRTAFLKDCLIRLAEIVSAMQLALGPMLSTIKKLSYQHDEITDWEHEAWLYCGEGAEAQRIYDIASTSNPRMVLTLENGTGIVNPIFEVSLENGKTFFIRTDGKSVIVPAVPKFIDE